MHCARMSFNQFPLHEDILKAVEDAGYQTPTPIQVQAIPMILNKRDVIGIAQTGTGKTAAFVLPILSDLHARPASDAPPCTKVLILAPTRELVNQIAQNIQTYGKYTELEVLVVTGGVGEANQIERLESGVDMVIATPGRLQELVDRGHARFDRVEYFVLDEADRMLDMGFLPAIEKIAKPLPKARKTLLFSATLSKAVEKLARRFLQNSLTAEVGNRTSPADTVTQHVYPVDKHLKAALLLHLLKDHDLFAVIAFVRTRIGADVLTKILRTAKIPVVALHGDKTQNHRQRAVRDFKDAKIRVLVATDVAARGLDIQGVTHVINYDFPEENDDYIHRIGRTGRAGSTGTAITFLTPFDENRQLGLEKYIKRTLARKKADGFDYKAPPPEQQQRQEIPSRVEKSTTGSIYSRANRPVTVPRKMAKKKKAALASSKASNKPAARPKRSDTKAPAKAGTRGASRNASTRGSGKPGAKASGKAAVKGTKSATGKRAMRKNPRNTKKHK
ncbi:MAG: ATP-dependent RNA helicase RhlE [Kiritimatiellia bacterium]|jgi:ATP-dependent RNA helicase RhlE